MKAGNNVTAAQSANIKPHCQGVLVAVTLLLAGGVL